MKMDGSGNFDFREEKRVLEGFSIYVGDNFETGGFEFNWDSVYDHFRFSNFLITNV